MPSDDHGKLIWPEVLGQRRVKRQLLSALRSGRLPHAYLFHGPEGVGKDAMAIELARVLHCERGGEEACGTCASCAQLRTLQHPGVRFITALPVGKDEDKDDGPLDRLTAEEIRSVQGELQEKGRDPYRQISIPRATGIKVSSIREIRREAPLSVGGRARRVFILSHAEMLTPVAEHALLKTLEEPPSHCMLILTTPNREELRPTIVSRCQQVRFDPLTEEQIGAALVERDHLGQSQAALLARLSGGSYTRARELLGDDLMQERKDVVDFVRRSVVSHHADVARIIENIAEDKGRARATRFLHLLLLWFRDALVLARDGAIINIDQEEPLKGFLAHYPASDIPAILGEIDRAISLVERNVYIKLVLYNLAGQIKANIR